MIENILNNALLYLSNLKPRDIRLRNDLAIFGEIMPLALLSLFPGSVIPVNRRSVARGTGDRVFNWGKATGLVGELRVPLQCPSLDRKLLPVPGELLTRLWAAATEADTPAKAMEAAEEDVTRELLAKVAVV